MVKTVAVLSLFTALCFFCACSGADTASDSGSHTANRTTEVESVVTDRVFASGSYAKISPEQAVHMMEESEDFIILDVRTGPEYDELHISGAALLPDNEIGERAETEIPDRNTLIFVYCRSGVRSENAANALIGMGYTNVYDIGGILSWPYETMIETAG